MSVTTESFAQYDFKDGAYHGITFSLCDFRQSRFSQSSWDGCLFVGCDFSFAAFGEASFVRCAFRNCSFSAAFMDSAKFEHCMAYGSDFEHVRFGKSEFNFVSTERSSFYQAKFTPAARFPGGCREIIGEMLRQMGLSSPKYLDLLLFGCMVTVHRQLCWREIVDIGNNFLSLPSKEKLVEFFQAWPNLLAHLSAFGADVAPAAQL